MKPVKQFLRRVLPIQVRNAVWYLRSRELREALAVSRLCKRMDTRVLSGPFTGLAYVDRSLGSTYPPKLLGTYEKELWPAVEEMIRTNYQTIIDIGAAEGYYAIGLANRMPQCKVVAFEVQTDQHDLLRELATKNNVQSRLTLLGLCTAANLSESLSNAGRALIICDCEGGEGDLLDPRSIAELKTADVLVETHDFVASGVSDELRRRFEPTHTIEQIPCAPRTDSDWPAGAPSVPSRWRSAAMAEHRPAEQFWLWMKSRAV
jgi:hypothetical protein